MLAYVSKTYVLVSMIFFIYDTKIYSHAQARETSVCQEWNFIPSIVTVYGWKGSTWCIMFVIIFFVPCVGNALILYTISLIDFMNLES